MSKVQEGRLLSPEESAAWLRGVLEPVMEKIKEHRRARAGIVMVTHRPGAVSLKALKMSGIPIQHLKRHGTTVFGTTCESFAAVWGRDLVTRGWGATPPADDETKIFLIVDDGSALITLTEDLEGTVHLLIEPDFIGPEGEA